MTHDRSPLGRILGLHVVISLAGMGGLALTLDWQHALSFGVGATMMGVNWWLLIQTWGQILGKKSIALALSIIVIKWTLFGAMCFYLTRAHWVMPISLILGISSVLVSSLIVAVQSNKLQREKL